MGMEGTDQPDASPARRAIVPQVAAGIVDILIDPYPLLLQPAHGEAVEQKATARTTGNAPFPPLAEMLTAQPCERGGGKGISTTSTAETMDRDWQNEVVGTSVGSPTPVFTTNTAPM